MRIRFNKENLIDYSILLLMYLQLVILEFFGFGRLLNKVVCVIIMYRVLFIKGKHWNTGGRYGILLSFLYVISVFMGEKIVYADAISTFLMLLYPMIYTYYIVFLCINKPDFVDECISKSFWLLNLTMVANIVALLFQIFVPYSIQAVVEEAQVILYYEDTISGFFQYASTHVVSLFTIFICLYDISYMKKLNNMFIKRILIIFVFLICAFSCYIAKNNDNKAFFLLFPLFLFAYWFAGGANVSKKIICIMSTGVLLITFILILYSFNDMVRTFLDDNLFHALRMIRDAIDLGPLANGSNERIAIIGYALALPSSWGVGTGFGSSGIYTPGYHGFYHFGQADFGSILLLGGVWFSLLILGFYLKSFMSIVGSVNSRNQGAFRFSVLVLLVSTSIYTQCYTRTNIMETLLLIMLAFRFRIFSEAKDQGRLE